MTIQKTARFTVRPDGLDRALEAIAQPPAFEDWQSGPGRPSVESSPR